jgi:hypothetical protein
MGQTTSSVKRNLLVIALAFAGLFALLIGPLNRAWGEIAVKQQPSAQLVTLGLKFEGATGCNAVKCHGATAPNPAPKPAGNEYITWSQKDKHATSWKALTEAPAKQIAAKLNIPNAETSPACTNCHALDVPANLQMGKFNVREGVTCGACHGPYEKWEKPHNQPGGADGLRTAAGYKELKAEQMPYSTLSPEHQKMLKDNGLYDTRPILARAEKCTSCHLAIDSKMIDAGHPTPIFELAYYTDLEGPHWREPAGYWATKVWAAGQVVCLRDAMLQLADRANGGAADKLVKDAYNQATGHLVVFRHVTGGKAAAALDAVFKDLKAAGNDKVKLAAAAKLGADAASSMMASVAALKTSEGNTAGLLTTISADADCAKEAGLRGAQQQALALASMCNCFKTGKGAVAGLDDVQKMIDEKLLALVGDETTFKPDEFTANLKAINAKLGTVVPGVPSVPDPIDLK